MSLLRLTLMVWFALITTHSLAAGSGQSFDILRLDYGPLQGPNQTLGSFERVDGRRWIETTVTNALFRYEEVDRTARAVYLYDRSRNVEVELNLSTRTIFYTTPHDTRRALFRIGQEQFAQARAAPGVCRRAVQGQVAWNYQGERRWNPENVRKLCAGASNAEPAYCFDQVMHGGVFWGGGTQWQWRNALSLCAGAVDARRTIRCFERELEFTNNWRQAINRCRQR